LKSFKTASYQQRDIQLQYFVDADALAYFQYDVISPDPDTFSLIDINSPYFASAIRLTFGPNSYYSALDDITFDVRAIDTMAVPGPIAGAGLPALMALGGLVAWRRRKAAVAA
jgi:LPXTG-motif cell wall-anchored protein